MDYVVHRWRDTGAALAAASNEHPPLHDGWPNHPLHHAAEWMEMIPPELRESYARSKKDMNPGFSWALHYAVTDWLFAARKNARTFAARKGFSRPKDVLDGRSEVLGPEGEMLDPDQNRMRSAVDLFWESLRNHPVLGDKQAASDKAERHFTGQQAYGAVTIIKRLWARAYLGTKQGEGETAGFFDFDVCEHLRRNFKSVIEIAGGPKETWDREDDERIELAPHQSYYAVLCFDGDEMGKWVSGVKSPLLKNQLAPEAHEWFAHNWDSSKVEGTHFDQVRRVLTPSYHAALSEALSNFALYCVRPIIEEFEGQLIYCGGDDVVAMLPAVQALACAEALYWTFRGQSPDTGDAEEVFASGALEVLLGTERREPLFEFLPKRRENESPGGFVRLANPKPGQPRWPFLVMGPRGTASVGIAIGHVRSPMQDTIQAARDAEARAKHHYGRDAFCLKILKRSGESLELGGRWRDGSQSLVRHPRVRLLEALLPLLANEHSGLSGRFPYRVGRLLRQLGLAARWAEVKDIAAAETTRALARQGKELSDEKRTALAALITDFARALEPEVRLNDYLAPFLAAAWLARHQQETSSSKTATPEKAHETIPA